MIGLPTATLSTPAALSTPAWKAGETVPSGPFDDQLLRVRGLMQEVLSRHTGQDVATLRADTDRDKIFTAKQAVDYGLADSIIASRELALAHPSSSTPQLGRGVATIQ